MKLSAREKKMLIFLAVLALVGGIVWLVIIPLTDNTSKLNAQKDDYRMQVIDAQSRSMPEDDLNKKLDEIMLTTQSKLDKYLPVNQLDILMTFLEDKSRQSGTDITGIRFLTPKFVNSSTQQSAPPADTNALGKLVADINSLNAGFMPQQPSAPQATPTPSASESNKPENMVSTEEVVINVTGTFNGMAAFIKAINDSGKVAPITALEMARDQDGKINGQITILLFNVPVPEKGSGTDKTGDYGNPLRDPFSTITPITPSPTK